MTPRLLALSITAVLTLSLVQPLSAAGPRTLAELASLSDEELCHYLKGRAADQTVTEGKLLPKLFSAQGVSANCEDKAYDLKLTVHPDQATEYEKQEADIRSSFTRSLCNEPELRVLFARRWSFGLQVLSAESTVMTSMNLKFCEQQPAGD